VGATADQLLLDRYALAAVVVTRTGEIVHLLGPTHEYLVRPPGPLTHNLFEQARDGLQPTLWAAVRKAIREDGPVTVSASLRRGEDSRRARITAEPLKGSPVTKGLILISFQSDDEGMVPGAPSGSCADESVAAGEPPIGQLEWELERTRRQLLHTIEQLETTNEELMAANQEATSANEELQSTNEELRTSKDELETLNERLNTINAELEAKVDELERTGNDLDNLLVSTNVPTIFLDSGFRVRRFTPAATRLFNLLPSDIDRPLADVVPRFTDPDLLRDAAIVLDRLSPVCKEIRTHDRQWYMREILPYRTREHRIEGVVLTFSNAAGGVLRAARLRTDVIVDMVDEAVLVMDGSMRVQSANRRFYEMFQTSSDETEKRILYELGEHEWDMPALRMALARVLERQEGFAHLELAITFARVGRRTLVLSARPVTNGVEDAPGLILLEIEDVTERKRREDALLASESKLRAIVGAAADGVVTIDEEGCITEFNRAAERMFGYAAGEMVGRSAWTLVPPIGSDEQAARIRRYRRTGLAKVIGTTRELVGRRKDCTTFPMELSVGEYHDGARGFVGIVRDISERKKAEEAADRQQVELARALRLGAMGELAASLGHELSQPLSVVANTLEACVTRLRSGPVRTPPLIRLLQEATGEVVRTGEIVQHVRDLLQNRQPRREQVDLRRVMEGVARLLARELKAHRITLHLDLGSRELPVGVVRVQLEQVLLNLLQNAIDAIRAGRSTRREVVARAATSHAGVVEVTVRDSGPGISDAVLRRMFEPLYTTKRRGLGMGLALSRSIVEAHGGLLSVACARRGQDGATLRFTLPLAATAHTPRRSHSRPRVR
jgi:two-component system CheB/CheR fusion protein